LLNLIIEFLSNNFILFTSFISILTLIAIYLTIAEMKNQRKSSFRPNLVMKSQVYGIRFNDEQYLIYDILEENEMKNSSGSNELPFITVKLFNVGLGPAKYLEFEWDYNIVSLVSLLNENQSQYNFIIKKENDNQDNLIIYRKDKQLFKSELDFKDYRDYALPVSISPHGIEVFIPFSYLEILVSVAFLYKFSEDEKAKLNYYEIFRSNLKIKTKVLYKDIEGNSCKQYFKLVPHLNLLKIFAVGKNEDEPIEFGFDIFEEIKK
jgi:hypothetical protein